MISPIEKPWHQLLLELLAGVWTSSQLGAAGASSEALQGATTAMVDLPTFGGLEGPPPGLEESRDLAHCHPELARRYAGLKADFAAQTGRQLFETCTWRSKERQAELYAQGRTAPGQIVTKLDGFTKKSRHNVWPSEAVDVCVDLDPGPGKHATWDNAAYEVLGALALTHGLVWGGDWNRNGSSADERFLDYPHIELPAEAV